MASVETAPERPSITGSACFRSLFHNDRMKIRLGPVAAIARQLGVSRSWASREAIAAGTRLLIAQVFEPHREQLKELFSLTLDLIKDAFQARKIFVVRGVIVDGWPDHYARLEVAKMVVQLLRQAD
jgi:hypothetical protein